ncbi:hypothetical protein QS306_03365 [Paraburkholderia bonniea]|uniref:hypothetical protein n=1 Tax=Paraburkholderia bonniea TaxID=2152891 RepID=UPI00257391D7|nr:hypothetical protein [Paraburkholderia bonniea]WJF90719.1 hypothetical protein QS306_03365 [Paraburkholderia bonniea]WJF94032.1 hypothetical protein QS308_03365 [Paraburkholderia bonniea]
MSAIDFIKQESEFKPLWQRAAMEVEMLRGKRPKELLYFDSVDLQTQKFFELVRKLLALKGATDFATLVLKPDPFSYFNFHFGKYPGFITRPCNTHDEFFDFMMQDPGDSPADALGVNRHYYVQFPSNGDWIIFGDDSWGIGMLYGPPDIMECARNFYRFFKKPPEDYKIRL